MVVHVGCGVCHSDLHVMKGELPFSTPCVIGHEITGEVVEHGAHTDNLVKQRYMHISLFIFLCMWNHIVFYQNKIKNSCTCNKQSILRVTRITEFHIRPDKNYRICYFETWYDQCGFKFSVWNFRFPIGSQVVGAFIMPCGNCFYCVKVIFFFLKIWSQTFVVN